jgi:hypothetical protein
MRRAYLIVLPAEGSRHASPAFLHVTVSIAIARPFSYGLARGGPRSPALDRSRLRCVGSTVTSQPTARVAHRLPKHQSGDIHELWWDGLWHHTNVTSETKRTNEIAAPPAKSSPTGYHRGITQRTVYVAEGGQLWELWWDGLWYGYNLTQSSRRRDGGEPPGADGESAAFVHAGRQHIVYRGEDKMIHKLVWP